MKLTTLLLPACLVAPLSAQALEEGYQTGFRGLPVAASAVTYLSNGSLVYFDTFTGTDLLMDDGSGTPSILLQLPFSVFASFAVEISPALLLFGESSTNEIWLVPLDGSALPSLLTTIDLNFAAAPFDADTALISAKTAGFFAPDNDVLALDLVTGAVDPIALIPGASGALTTDENGDLYYATASSTFPQPKGFVDILRFDRSLVQSAFGPGVLTPDDATVVMSGIDAAGSLAFDSDRDLFLVDWANNKVLEISDVDGPVVRLTTLFDFENTGLSAASVQFVPGVGSSDWRFEPFQPLHGGALAVVETDFFSETNVRFATPARPLTVVTPSVVPAGPFAMYTIGGPANGVGVMRWGLPINTHNELGVPIGIYEQLIPWGLSSPTTPVPITFDATGTSALFLNNPGFGVQFDFAVQVIFVNPAATVVGSAAPEIFSLL